MEYSRSPEFLENNRDRPRDVRRSANVTKGRPSKFCHADFRKLISPFNMSIISSLSEAM